MEVMEEANRVRGKWTQISGQEIAGVERGTKPVPLR
jgi:hypothetical protein